MTTEKSEGREFDPHPGQLVLSHSLGNLFQVMGCRDIQGLDMFRGVLHPKTNAPGEARTHNLRIASASTAYKYGALTDCATGARRLKAALKW